MNNILLIIAIVVMSIPTTVLACYFMSAHNIFFTRVPAGEIIVVMYSEKVSRFIGNIDGFWVHPETGAVYDEKTNPVNVTLPKDFFGTGIYWLGVWPLAERYSYEFHWNKWTKEKDEKTGKENSEYSIVSRSGIVDSLYFRAQYPVQASGCETSEGVPLTMTILITTETVNADISLFKIKSPGWLSALSGQAMAVIRDWNGKRKVTDITVLQAEVPEKTDGKRSSFQELFFTLNKSDVGNPGIEEMYGQKIVAVSFVSYSIDKPTNDLQSASIKKYQAEREKEATILAAKAKNAAATEEAKAIKKTADATAYTTVATGTAEAKVTVLKGDAEAGAAKKMTAAVRGNPHAGTIALARAIEKQQHATTVVIGQGLLPTKNI